MALSTNARALNVSEGSIRIDSAENQSLILQELIEKASKLVRELEETKAEIEAVNDYADHLDLKVMSRIKMTNQALIDMKNESALKMQNSSEIEMSESAKIEMKDSGFLRIINGAILEMDGGTSIKVINGALLEMKESAMIRMNNGSLIDMNDGYRIITANHKSKIFERLRLYFDTLTTEVTINDFDLPDGINDNESSDLILYEVAYSHASGRADIYLTLKAKKNDVFNIYTLLGEHDYANDEISWFDWQKVVTEPVT